MLAPPNKIRVIEKSNVTRATLCWVESIHEWAFCITGEPLHMSPHMCQSNTLALQYLDGEGGFWLRGKEWRDDTAAEAWLLRHFPTFVKVGNAFYNPAEETVTDEGDIQSYHPITGTLFTCIPRSSDTDKTVTYATLDENPEVLQAVKRGINGETEGNDAFYYALVRRRTPDGWKYYPLPLVYASEQERVLAAQAINSTPPPERWIRRRQKAVDVLLTSV